MNTIFYLLIFFLQPNKRVFHSYIFPLPKHTWEKIKIFSIYSLFHLHKFFILLLFHHPTKQTLIRHFGPKLMVCFIGGEKWMDRKKGRGKVERRYKILLFGNKKKKEGKIGGLRLLFHLSQPKINHPKSIKKRKRVHILPIIKSQFCPIISCWCKSC